MSSAQTPPAPEAPRKDILLTGFPSFLPRRLLATLLRHHPDATIRLLVRPDFMDQAEAVLHRMCQHHPEDRERIVLFRGDVVAMDLGLSGREFLDLVAHVTDIFHMASVWYLGVRRKQAYEVNVLGARNILEAADEMLHLRRLNHLSTAFVSGDRAGVIMEHELDEGQRLRNHYEQTKFEAEQLMRESSRFLPISVFRPSIIVGDSMTGEIDRMAGPYYLMNAILKLPPNVPALMPGKGDKPLNLVPVDYVCEAMTRIAAREDAAGKTFHLTDPNPLSAREVFNLVAAEANRPAPRAGAAPFRLARLLLRFPYLERFTRSQRQFLDDFNHLAIYNNMNTLQALEGQVPCPPFPSYIEQLIAFILTHTDELELDLPINDLVLG